MKTGSFEQIVNAGASSCLQRHERAKLAEGFSSTLRTDAFGDGSVKVDVYNDESILDSNNEDPTKRYRSHVVATGLKKNASLGGQPLWDESPLRHCPHGNASLHAAPPPATWHMHMREHMHNAHAHAPRLPTGCARSRMCPHTVAVLRGIVPVTREPWAVDEEIYNRNSTRDTTMDARGACQPTQRLDGPRRSWLVTHSRCAPCAPLLWQRAAAHWTSAPYRTRRVRKCARSPGQVSTCPTTRGGPPCSARKARGASELAARCRGLVALIFVRRGSRGCIFEPETRAFLV